MYCLNRAPRTKAKKKWHLVLYRPKSNLYKAQFQLPFVAPFVHHISDDLRRQQYFILGQQQQGTARMKPSLAVFLVILFFFGNTAAQGGSIMSILKSQSSRFSFMIQGGEAAGLGSVLESRKVSNELNNYKFKALTRLDFQLDQSPFLPFPIRASWQLNLNSQG